MPSVGWLKRTHFFLTVLEAGRFKIKAQVM